MTLPAGIIKTDHPDGSSTYHLGTLFDGTVPFQVGPYTDNGESVPAHYWHSDWTYRPGSIKAVRSPAEIVAAKRMFPYGDTSCKYGMVTVKPYTIMGPASVTPYMPTTGERPDIGLLTDWSAWYMLKGDPGPMIEIAKASGSFPFHYRDETTGKPIDILKYFDANTNDAPGWGTPWIQRFPLNPDGSANIGGGLHPQQAHFPEMSYLAYCATQDAGFLKELQYAANYTTFCDAAISHIQKKAIPSGELRGLAWAFRNLFMAHIATQDAEARGALPDTCHPASYWKQLLDQALAYYSKHMTDPANQVFRLIYGPGEFGPWQDDFMILVLGFGVLTGHDDWAPLYLWALKNAIDRNSNALSWQSGGFPPGYGTPYYMDGTKPDWYSAFLAMFPPEAPPPTQDQIDKLKADPLNGGVMMGTLHEAMMTTRAVLVTADYLEKLGLAKVRQAYPEFDVALAHAEAMFQAYGSVNPRISIVSTTQPPQGGLMPTSFSIVVGASEQLNLVLNGALTDGPIYTTDAPNIVSLEPNVAGVIVTGLAAGSAKITATGTGATELSAESDATVTLPLATTMELVPA